MYHVKDGKLFVCSEMIPGLSDIVQFDVRFGRYECIIAVDSSGNVWAVLRKNVFKIEDIDNVLRVHFGEYPVIYFIKKNGIAESVKITEDGRKLDRTDHIGKIDMNGSTYATMDENGFVTNKSGDQLFQVNPEDVANVFGIPNNICVLVLHKNGDLHTYIDYVGSYIEGPVVNNVTCIPG